VRADFEAADIWTTAFLIPLTKENIGIECIPTTDDMRGIGNWHALGSQLQQSVDALVRQYRFFHWQLEFPEIFSQGGFDCIIGNPPFLGELKISTNFAERHHKFLLENYYGSSGKADYCGYFFRRAFDTIKTNGFLGLLATKTISQGDTRQSSLAIIIAKKVK
jgi:hypothetical protein